MNIPYGQVYRLPGVASFTTNLREDTRRGDELKPRNNLSGSLSAVGIGETIPIVFCKRENDRGGVLITPKVTECRFSNDVFNRVHARYRFVLSEGQLGSIASADVYQGQHSVSYLNSIYSSENKEGKTLEYIGPVPSQYYNELVGRPSNIQTVSDVFTANASISVTYGGPPSSWSPGNSITQKWASPVYNRQVKTLSGAAVGAGEDEESKLIKSEENASGYVTSFSVSVRMTDWDREASPFPPARTLEQGLSLSRSPSLNQINIRHFLIERITFNGDVACTYEVTTTTVTQDPYEKPDAPLYCGTGGGSYDGLTVLDYSCNFFNGDTWWSKAVYVFVRNGIQVPLVGGGSGSSNNVVDLIYYLLTLNNRVPTELVDTASLVSAAQFVATQGFTYDGILTEPTNIRDFINRIAPFFMLAASNRDGKLGVVPVLPANSSGALYTGPVTPRFTFTAEHVVPETFDLTYTELGERKPFIASMLWRQQPDDDIHVVRTTDVRYGSTPSDAPIEQYDMLDFCTSEDHAVKIGMYFLARRRYITHTLSLEVRPGGYNVGLYPGDVVRVTLPRAMPDGTVTLHDSLYQLSEISESVTGNVSLNLTHFPVDGNGVSLIARDVAAAKGGGSTIGTGLSGVIEDFEDWSNQQYLPFVGLEYDQPDEPDPEVDGLIRIQGDLSDDWVFNTTGLTYDNLPPTIRGGGPFGVADGVLDYTTEPNTGTIVSGNQLDSIGPRDFVFQFWWKRSTADQTALNQITDTISLYGDQGGGFTISRLTRDRGIYFNFHGKYAQTNYYSNQVLSDWTHIALVRSGVGLSEVYDFMEDGTPLTRSIATVKPYVNGVEVPVDYIYNPDELPLEVLDEYEVSIGLENTQLSIFHDSTPRVRASMLGQMTLAIASGSFTEVPTGRL